MYNSLAMDHEYIHDQNNLVASSSLLKTTRMIGDGNPVPHHEQTCPVDNTAEPPHRFGINSDSSLADLDRCHSFGQMEEASREPYVAETIIKYQQASTTFPSPLVVGSVMHEKLLQSTCYVYGRTKGSCSR